MVASNTYGRQVVVPLTNKSGGGVIAGDVVIVDTSNNDAFTTTTSANFTGGIGIAQETIASNAVGRVLISGYAALVNVQASVTRGHFGATYTVAKQATDAGASRGAGTFCQFLTGGTTPDALMYPVDLLGSSLTNPMTTVNDLIIGGSSGTPTRLAAVASKVLSTDVSGNISWATPASGGITRTQLGTTSLGGSFDTTMKTVLKKITLSSAGLIASIAVGLKGQSTSGFELTAFVMSDNSGTPLNLVALGGNPTRTFATAGGGVSAHTHQLTAMGLINSTARYVTVPIGVWLAAGDYWIGVVNNANSGSDVQLAFTGSGSDWTGSGTDGPYDQSVASYSSGSSNYSLFANFLT